ncbi:MAG: hypothetical protein AB1847_19740 [bacterium]
MGPEEWKKMEDLLKQMGRLVRLDCDGYQVAFVLAMLSQYKNGIVFYVNGVFKSAWMNDDCEERRRFFDSRDRFLCSGKKRESLNENADKRILKEAGIDIDKKYTYYIPWWVSFKRLKKHLIENNKAIKLLYPLDLPEKSSKQQS